MDDTPMEEKPPLVPTPPRAPWLRPAEALTAAANTATEANPALARAHLTAALDEAYYQAARKGRVQVDGPWRAMCRRMGPDLTRDVLGSLLQRAENCVQQWGRPRPALALFVTLAYWEAGHLRTGWMPRLRAFWDAALEKRPERLYVSHDGQSVDILGWPPGSDAAREAPAAPAQLLVELLLWELRDLTNLDQVSDCRHWSRLASRYGPHAAVLAVDVAADILGDHLRVETNGPQIGLACSMLGIAVDHVAACGQAPLLTLEQMLRSARVASSAKARGGSRAQRGGSATGQQ
ncbi:hypothetical protein BOX15_Mlig013834g1 [Macrostomum lignano]|uniref:Uncharacterized protein n=1 Tax=Macrostomum lignano TaxID=282301 RepID=A0A267FHQ4_9PLAT|nr:hypothetical protein BOX15_Mlig013834g1 [Macrostomum lignano]